MARNSKFFSCVRQSILLEGGFRGSGNGSSTYPLMPLFSFLLWVLTKAEWLFPCTVRRVCEFQQDEWFLQPGTLPSSDTCLLERMCWKWDVRCRVVTAFWWMFPTDFQRWIELCQYPWEGWCRRWYPFCLRWLRWCKAFIVWFLQLGRAWQTLLASAGTQLFWMWVVREGL